MPRYSSQSTFFLRSTVTTQLPDGSQYDPTADAVGFAFLEKSAKPDGSTLPIAGSWFGAVGDDYVAQVLVGPGGSALAVGDYSVWVKITDDPEVVWLPAGMPDGSGNIVTFY